MRNPYLPQSVKIVEINQETPEIKKIVWENPIRPPLVRFKKQLHFTPGQFILAGVWGAGEAPFGLANNPYNPRHQTIFVRRTGGKVTSALHQLKPGDKMTIRGPYGRGFFLDKMISADIVAIAGGCGIPPIASFLEYAAVRRSEFGKIYLIYGAGSKEDFAARSRFPVWRKKKIDLILTIDRPEPGWRGRTGYVSEYINQLAFDPEKTFAIMCGPGPMFQAAAKVLTELGLPDQRILISEERKMSCGIGKCQHCTCGKYYTCLDGPVFSYDQIKNFHD